MGKMEGIIFECPNCQATFKVEVRYLGVNRVTLNCPNCDLAFPQNALTTLKQMIEKYHTVQDECGEWKIGLTYKTT